MKKLSPAKSTDIKRYADKIEKFLKRAKNPYSEATLADELFGIPLKKEGYVPKSNEVKKLKAMKEALRHLMDEKIVVGATLEDPTSNEQILHYSISGWYATP